MENLESRVLFAVSISTTGDYVRIVGDDGGTGILLEPQADVDGGPIGGLQLTIGPDVELDRRFFEGYYTFDLFDTPELGKPWVVDLGHGSDTFRIESFFGFSLPMTIRMGAGKDRFECDDFVTWSSISIDGGSGIDLIKFNVADKSDLDGTTRIQNLSIFGGSNRDLIDITDVAVSGQFQLEDTRGPLNLTLTRVSVSKTASIVTGNSIDHLFFDHCSFGRKAVISTHGGKDTIYNVSSRFKVGADVFAGDDDDQVVGIV